MYNFILNSNISGSIWVGDSVITSRSKMSITNLTSISPTLTSGELLFDNVSLTEFSATTIETSTTVCVLV